MVLWELTLATAYFLGLKRTYRLAIRIQRRVLPRNQRIRDFAHRRTRVAFDTVINIHKKVSGWDMSAGKRLGKWLLRNKTPEPPVIVPQPPVVDKVVPKMPSFPVVRPPFPSSINLIPGWRPMNKNVRNSERLYSVFRRFSTRA